MKAEIAVKERPILFSGAMVQAILAGRKTQTRRVIKPQPDTAPGMNCTRIRMKRRDGSVHLDTWVGDDLGYLCPYGVPGDRLWVREASIITPKHWDSGPTFTHRDADGDKRWVQYLATSPDTEAAKDYGLKVTPSIHMPRWASRLTLEITEVRVQRLQEISASDCLAEGIQPEFVPGVDVDIDGFLWRKGERKAVAAFQSLWDSINAKRGHGWEKNPWIWAVSFRRLP